MKNKVLYIIPGLLMFSLFFLISGCEKDDEIGPTVTVTSVNPNAAYGLDEVTIQGENLNTVRALFVGDKNAQVVSQDASSLTFIVPKEAAPGQTLITLAMLNNYRVTAAFEMLVRPIPEIYAISPSAGAPGDQITIAGLNLGSLQSLTVANIEATIVSATNAELVFEVPDGAPNNQPAEIKLTTEEVEVTNETVFFVGQNMIQNSDFEAGSGDDFDSWEKLNGGDQMTEVSGNDAYYGRSIRIVGANNPDQPWRTQLASAEMQLNFESEYTAMMWVKAEAEGASMRISASQFNHHGSGSDYFYGDQMEIPTEWTQLTWTFTVGADLPSHKLVLDMGFTDVPFLVDNVILIETGAAGPGIPENLLGDGGFENGLYSEAAPNPGASWQILNGTIEITTVADEVHCGDQAIKVTGAGANPWDTQLAADVVPLEFEKQYEVRLWAKAAGPDAIMRVSCSRWNNSNGDDYFYGSDVTLTEEWAEYSWVFTVGKDIPDGHHLVLDMGASAQVFFIDDVSLKAYVPPVNILPDGGFENGLYSESAPNENATWQILNGTIEVTTNADEVFSGSQAIKVTGAGANPWDTQLAADVVPLTFEGRYGVKLMAKAAGPDAVMRISASRWNNSNGDDYFYGDDVTLTEEWAEYTWEFTVGKDIPDGHHIVLDMGASAQIFFIDDVVLYEIPAFTCP